MKKLIFSLSALAALLLAGSCQRENLEPMQQGGTVTYTVQVPGALATKTATENYELIYEVYRKAQVGTSADPIYDGKRTFSGNSVDLPLEFVKGQDFVVLFWAQKENLTAYNTGNLRNVTLGTLTANQENYEVFAGMDEVSNCVSSNNGNVELVRPIAQLNIATDAEGLKLGNTDVTLTSSFVTVKGLSTTYNVYNKAVSETLSDVEFSVAAVPTGKLGNTDYTYVAMNYIGFIDANGTTVDVDFTVKTSEGDIAHSVSSVPVKPNYKTNIIGNLITATDNYKVTLGAWGNGETNVEVVAVSTAQELQEAIKNIQPGAEGNIILEGNIDLGTLADMISTKADEPVAPTYGLVIPADKTIILDLNGCTLNQEVECTASYSMIKNQGNLTITGNGTISFKDLSTGGGSTWGSYIIDNTGYLTVENGTIVHLGSTNFPIEDRPTNLPIQNYAGKVVINGGIISSPSFRSLRDFTAGGEIIINGGQFLGQVWMQGLGAGSSSLTINGGEFNPTAGYDGSSVYITNGTNDVQVSITGGTFNTKIGCADSNKSGVKGCITGGLFKADPSAFVADDYVAVYDENAKVWNIAEAYAKVGETKYTSLNDAFGAALKLENANIVVLRDSEMTPITDARSTITVANGKTITLDLNGKTVSTITSGTGNQDVILVKGTLNVTNGTITTEHKGENLGWSAMSTIFDITAGGVVNLNGVTAKNLGGTDMGFVAHLNNWGEVTLTAENCTLESNYVAVRVFNSGYDKNNVTIKNSTLKGGNYAFWVHNYTVADFGTAEKAIAQQKLLNFNLTEGNTYVGKNDTPIRLGMTGSMYLAADQIGNLPTYASVDSEETLIAALKNASSVNSIIYFANDITISNKWDNRYTGAKTSKPIEINGNGKTLKFTGLVEDKNYMSVFRFENVATVKNLTIDLSEATNTGQMRAISSKSTLSVENCTFLGKSSTQNTRAIIFGEGANPNFNFGVSIKNSTFTNWKRGITDNENGQDIKEVVIEGNTCTNAHVYVSAYESITFNNNILNNSCVNIRSYKSSETVRITAKGNTLDSNLSDYNVIGHSSNKCDINNIDAQEGFIVYAE